MTQTLDAPEAPPAGRIQLGLASRVLARPEIGALVAAVIIFIFFLVLAPSFRSAESFFSSLKKERVRSRVYASREEARSDVFDYIEVFYNRQRRHGHMGGLVPMMFEEINSKSSA